MTISAPRQCFRGFTRKVGLSSSDKQKWLVTPNWSANGYRLPTEAEWEYSCRGGTTTVFYWGDGFLWTTGTEYAWYDVNALSDGSHPVGTKLPNAFGLYDMSGNVFEWCWDWYGIYSQQDQIDPKGPVSGGYRVIRGGSWNYPLYSLRSADRTNGGPPGEGYGDIGFRVSRFADKPQKENSGDLNKQHSEK